MTKSALNYYKYCNQKSGNNFLPMFHYEKITKTYRDVDYINGRYIYQGVIISERTGFSESVIDGFFDGVKDDAGQHYHLYTRPNDALANGLSLLRMADNHHKQLESLFNQ